MLLLLTYLADEACAMDSRLEIVTSDDKDIGVNLIVANNLVLFSGEMLEKTIN